MIVVRYADDSVVGFERPEDARAFLASLRVRLSQFGLSLNEEKTRILEFGRYALERRARRGQRRPETFDFPGFTHICAKRRKDGSFIVWRLTVAKRMRATLKAIRESLMRRRHLPIKAVGRWLRSVVQGYLNYHAVPGNLKRLATSKGWNVPGRGLPSLAARHFAPQPALAHAMGAFPTLRVMTQGKSRMRLVPLVRICAGGVGKSTSLPRPPWRCLILIDARFLL